MDDEHVDSVQMAPVKKSKGKSGGFQTMGLSWQLLKSVLNMGYKIPTPIQRKAIPEILLGKDVVAMARTGSGKTAAFLIPMFQRLQKAKENYGPRALIMSPTRELALQTFKFTKQLAKHTDLKAAIILGGDKIEDQFNIMHENPDIIIATPGRFLHITLEMSLKLSTVEYVVFDEADRLFEMGFQEQLGEILHKLRQDNRQTLLFSATLPASLVEFAKAGLQQPILLRLDIEAKLSDKLKLAYIQTRNNEDKLALLNILLKKISVNNSQTIIFVSTRHHVEFIKDLLTELNYTITYVYSSLDQTARKINIAKFQNKICQILVVTDIAARGIDIPLLDNVINYDFPAKSKLFIHRVGRVARAGQSGCAFSFVTNDELPYLIELHEYLGKELKLSDGKMNTNDDWNHVYGKVPQAQVDIEREYLEGIIDSKIELSSELGVLKNAFKHYLKSRPVADSNYVKISKKYRQACTRLALHPIFINPGDVVDDVEVNAIDLLEKLKAFKPRQTVFELHNTSSTQRSSVIMRQKREKDEKLIEKYATYLNSNIKQSMFEKNLHDRIIVEKLTNDESDNDDGVKNFEADNLQIKVTDGDKADKPGKKKKKIKEVIDVKNFIPYKSKNFEQEKQLGINNPNSFNKQASSAILDLNADDQQTMRKNTQKTKWDRKKKKFVSADEVSSKNIKKIKTESGQYVNATYKSDLYAKWLKKSKVVERTEVNDDEDAKPRKRFFGSDLQENKYFGSHKYKATGARGVKRFKVTENTKENYKRRRGGADRGDDGPQNGKKRFGTGLKSKDQILKERSRKEKVQKFQKKRQVTKSKRSGGKNKR